MQLRTVPIPLQPSKSGILVTDGYGIRIRVERGHLVVSDGIGPLRRESRFARATVGIKRLVLVGHTGFVTLDALRWLADVGIGFMHLDPDGNVLSASAGIGLNDPRLRRAQALSWRTEVGVAIARDLLRQKLTGQATVAANLPDGAATKVTIEALRSQLDQAASPPELMVVEAAAANTYWDAWSSISMPWTRVDARKVPEHWHTFGSRSSPLTGNPRLAANPANAILNYLYAILEGEARLACLATGLDPGLGVLHADQKSRDSLALDVMEAVRPDVDAYLLELLGESVFRAADFVEGRQGHVRSLPPLTHRLAETAPHWARLLAPVVERVAQAFADSPDSRVDRLPTPLTQMNRWAGRDHLRRHRLTIPEKKSPRLERSMCRGCGVATGVDRAWCDACRPSAKLEAGLDGLTAARAKRADLRSRGQDPAASSAAKARRRDTLARRQLEESAWVRTHPEVHDPAEFQRDILPSIQAVPVRQLAKATGLSVSYCALIRRGLHTPHPRWWQPLAQTVAQTE